MGRGERLGLILCGFLRRLVEAELVDDARLNGVLAAPVAEDVPGDLRRTPDEEFEAPDVRVVVVPRRRREKDGAPPLREAPESITFAVRRRRRVS